MAEFKKGDTVRLKSGGPLMTVTNAEKGRVWVSWFDKSENEKSSVFNAEALDADDGGPVIA
jgi:uncharacterized protein YodC (DUF2158 family)